MNHKEIDDWSPHMIKAESSLRKLEKDLIHNSRQGVNVLCSEIEEALMEIKLWAYKKNAEQANQQRP